MSEILSEAQRARLKEMERERLARFTRPPDRTDTVAKRAGAIGCLVMLALCIAGFAGVVALVWRRVFWG